MDNLITYACDVGSTKRDRFGWARVKNTRGGTAVEGSRSIDKFIERLKSDIGAPHPLAIGFEAPQFIPVPREENRLSQRREGEEDRSCFAPIGGYVTTLSLHQVCYILSKLKSSLIKFNRKSILDLASWQKSPGTDSILFWEAFVSGNAHSEAHERDAATAAITFHQFARRNSFPTTSVVRVNDSDDIFSFLGAAIFWGGLSKDAKLLRASVYVVKPEQCYCGEIVTPPSPS